MDPVILAAGVNTGVIWRDPQPEDDKALAGGESRIVYEERVKDGQHDAWIPTDQRDVEGNLEIQISQYTETNTCTNQGTSNSIDEQGNWLLANNKIPADKVRKLEEIGFIVNERFNTSERYNALTSDTNGGQYTDRPRGNYAYKPWDAARNSGMIPEKLLPFTRGIKLLEYFDKSKLDSDEIREAANTFLQILAVQYEIIPTDPDSLMYHLKQAPITVITGVCNGWGSQNPVQACDLSSGHETALYGFSKSEFWKDIDSYNPLAKRLAWNYKIGHAIKGVLLLRDDLNTLKYNFTKPMVMEALNGDSGRNSIADVKALQVALHLQGLLQDSNWPTRELVQKFGGYFGENTKAAVKRLQAKYGLPQTGEVWYQTLALLNQLYNV